MPAKTRRPSGSERNDAIRTAPSLQWSAPDSLSAKTEDLVVEAPLAIEIAYPRQGVEVRKVLAVTMRTPGQDDELALGFLLAEGLITTPADVAGVEARDHNARGEAISTWCVRLAQPPAEDLQRVSRGLLTSSACGLCGRPSLEGLPLRSVARNAAAPLDFAVVAALPETLRLHQPTFFATGGCHAAALCDARGRLHLAREDVGRHNAVDKLVGAALQGGLALSGLILVLSGRASFELLQKAASAGIGVVVAVGAPSSAAVDLAHAAGITLCGFARVSRLNVYTHADRLALGTTGSNSGPRDPSHDRSEALPVR
jgi:FdhD protein